MFERRGYLLDVSRRLPNRRVMCELVDLLAAQCYNEFCLVGLPPDALMRPHLKSYCEMQGIELVEFSDESDAGRVVFAADTVSAPTERAFSLAGRVEDMREKMEQAEAAGRQRKARRFLVVDFADEYAWEPIVVSLPGIILGGNFAASGAKAAKMDLERALDRAMNAPVGGILLRLGTLYLRGGAVRDGESELHRILAHDHGYSRHPGMTDSVLEDIGGVAEGCRLMVERYEDANDWAKEVAYVARLVDAATHRRDERRLRELRDEHGRIWRLRYEEEGRVESLCRLPRF